MALGPSLVAPLLSGAWPAPWCSDVGSFPRPILLPGGPSLALALPLSAGVKPGQVSVRALPSVLAGGGVPGP